MRNILHLDLDAFFCAVEELDDPSLQGKAFAVGGRPEARGVHSAMPMKAALSQCPGLLIIPPHQPRYRALSRQVMAVLGELSPLVEQISVDEAFVDISDLGEPVREAALRVQRRIANELGLPCSIGIAANKLVAKIATEVGKHAGHAGDYPRALCMVEAGREAEFLAPLPAAMLWGVGKKTEAALAALGMHTIGDIARWPAEDLARRFGKNGEDLARHARGLDERPVVTEHEAKSISQEVTFSHDRRDDKEIEATLKALCGEVARTLRQQRLAGKTVKLKLRWPDFTTLTRQATLPSATNQEQEIYATALTLLRQVRFPGRAVRLIGVGVSGLGTPARQMELWGQESEKQRKLQAALDVLEEKFGDQIFRKRG